MTKPATRRISFYMNLEQVKAERAACDILDAMPAAERGRMQRSAMMAGLALAHLDPRLPHLLAELMAGPIDTAAVHHLIGSILPAERRQLPPTPAPLPTPLSDNTDPLAAMRKNAAGMFPT